MEGQPVACSIVFTAYSLARIGETIHDIRIEREKLKQQGVDSQYNITLPCSYGSESSIDSNQEECTKEDVPVDSEKTFQRRIAA